LEKQEESKGYKHRKLSRAGYSVSDFNNLGFSQPALFYDFSRDRIWNIRFLNGLSDTSKKVNSKEVSEVQDKVVVTLEKIGKTLMLFFHGKAYKNVKKGDVISMGITAKDVYNFLKKEFQKRNNKKRDSYLV